MVALRRLPSLWKAVSFWITMIPCASPTELAESPARSQAGAFHRFCSRGGRAQVAESVLQVSTGSLSRQDVVSATRQCIFCNSCLGRWILLVSPLHLLGRVGRAIRRVGSPRGAGGVAARCRFVALEAWPPGTPRLGGQTERWAVTVFPTAWPRLAHRDGRRPRPVTPRAAHPRRNRWSDPGR